MIDKEVGELLLDLHKVKPADMRGELYAEILIGLICKLVEERNCRRIGCQNFDEHAHPFGERPITDFNIPEEAWPNG